MARAPRSDRTRPATQSETRISLTGACSLGRGRGAADRRSDRSARGSGMGSVTCKGRLLESEVNVGRDVVRLERENDHAGGNPGQWTGVARNAGMESNQRFENRAPHEIHGDAEHGDGHHRRIDTLAGRMEAE